jgi:hypothetical protein
VNTQTSSTLLSVHHRCTADHGKKEPALSLLKTKRCVGSAIWSDSHDHLVESLFKVAQSEIFLHSLLHATKRVKPTLM